MSRVLVVANRKGGTGKTATAVNLAAEAGAAGLKTLLVDLDTQGHAGLGFDVALPRGGIGIHDAYRRADFDVREAIRPSRQPNVAVVPADTLFDGEAAERSPFLLKRLLARDEIARAFDLVVVDTPPAYDLLLVNALIAADAVVVPVMPSALAAEGVRQFARVFFRVAATVNPGARLLGLLPVMVDRRLVHQRRTLSELASEYGAERLLDGIRTDVRVSEAFAARRPVRAYDPRSRGAADYARTFEALARRLDEPSLAA